MSLETLLERNTAFAVIDAVARNPKILCNPSQFSCIDPRTEPGAFHGVDLGGVIVQRTVGGRVTPAVGVAYSAACRVGKWRHR